MDGHLRRCKQAKFQVSEIFAVSVILAVSEVGSHALASHGNTRYSRWIGNDVIYHEYTEGFPIHLHVLYYP